MPAYEGDNLLRLAQRTTSRSRARAGRDGLLDVPHHPDGRLLRRVGRCRRPRDRRGRGASRAAELASARSIAARLPCSRVDARFDEPVAAARGDAEHGDGHAPQCPTGASAAPTPRAAHHAPARNGAAGVGPNPAAIERGPLASRTPPANLESSATAAKAAAFELRTKSSDTVSERRNCETLSQSPRHRAARLRAVAEGQSASASSSTRVHALRPQPLQRVHAPTDVPVRADRPPSAARSSCPAGATALTQGPSRRRI